MTQHSYMIAWCTCINEHGDTITINAMHHYDDDAHLATLQRYLVSELHHQIGRNGGPWGWTIGPLHIDTQSLSGIVDSMTETERDAMLTTITSALEPTP